MVLIVLSIMPVQMYIPTSAEAEDLVQFHDSDYIAFLRTVTPDNQVNVSLTLHQSFHLCRSRLSSFSAQCPFKTRTPMHDPAAGIAVILLVAADIVRQGSI